MADLYTDLYNKLSELAEKPLSRSRVKGPGFFGLLNRTGGNSGDISGELSVGVGMDGKETEIPTMVPGLSKKELDYLLATKLSLEMLRNPIGQEIVRKAVVNAQSRKKEGKDPFAGRWELNWPTPKQER